MNIDLFAQLTIDKANELRENINLAELLSADDHQLLKDVYFKEQSFEFQFDADNDEETLRNFDTALKTVFEERSSDLMKMLLDSNATHIDARAYEVDEDLRITLEVFYLYIELDPIGPMIDGSLVLSGTAISDKQAPAFCTIEYAANNHDYKEIGLVAPWAFMLSSGAQKPLHFTIPISLPDEYKDVLVGMIRLIVYMDDVNVIPFDNESTQYDMVSADKRRLLIKAIMKEVSPSASQDTDFMDMPKTPHELLDPPSDGEFAAGEANVASDEDRVVIDIKIATDYDDMLQFQNEGYEVFCTQVTPKGPEHDQEQQWRFHIMAKLGPRTEIGIEDVIWIRCLKSLGVLPTVPFFNIIHEFDLSDEDDNYAVYIAYKSGMNPLFRRIVMLSCNIEHEMHLTKYLRAFNAVFRAAPLSISKNVGGPCGLLLMMDANATSDATNALLTVVEDTSVASNESGGGASPAGKKKKMKKSKAGDESDENSVASSSVDSFDDEEDWEFNLKNEIEELMKQKEGLLAVNAELQKKAIALMSREKMMQGQTAAARTVSEVVAQTTETTTETVNTEANLEKDKQYHDTMQQIVEQRIKLSKQLKEFDQLAHDLQTRLDDKELKANGIASTFKQFKKEVLNKAEHTRTGHLIAEKDRADFEAAELKHEEDLEKVRLRNISLRTTYRKLERTLRAREQLAEGLHMIDFEQLKIENQTLNEKIEERNEDLAKLKRKKTTNVLILTHVREKLRFIEQANENLTQKLAQVEVSITSLRGLVTTEKLTRDALRFENKELKAKQGFATSDLLLVDYEQRCNKVEALKAGTTELKDRYAVLKRQVEKSATQSSTTPWVMSNSLKSTA